MARSVRRPCLTPGCPALCPRGEPRCPKHAAQHASRVSAEDRQRRGNFRERGYIGWDRVRDQYRAQHPVCEVCGSDRNVRVHHRVPVAVDPSRRLDTSNLITLCAAHHAQAHA